MAAYEDRYVAFIDILGFGDIVERSASDRTLLTELSKAIQSVRTESIAITYAGTDQRSTTFSDSIVISAPRDAESLSSLFGTICRLWRSLARSGALLRGGVSAGSVFHSEGAIFGPAMNSAYRLESTIADYPRVVLSKDVVAESLDAFCAPDPDNYESEFLYTADGPAVVNVLKDFKKCNYVGSEEWPDRDIFLLEGNAIREQTQTKLFESIDNPSVYRKLKWFAEHWNWYVCHPYDSGLAKIVSPSEMSSL